MEAVIFANRPGFRRYRRAALWILCAAAVFPLACTQAVRRTQQADAQPPADLLVNGKLISPQAAGSAQSVGNLPMNLLLSPDARFVITSTTGYYESLWSIRTADGEGISHVEFSNKRTATTRAARIGSEVDSGFTPAGSVRSYGLYYGLAITPRNTVYAAQGAHDSIAVLDLGQDGTLNLRDQIKTSANDFPAGLALDDAGRLYVANNASGDADPVKLSGSLAIFDPISKKELGRYAFTNSHGGTSNFPLGIAVLRDGRKTYLAAERDDAVYVLDTHDPSSPSLLKTLSTGAHPVALLLSADQRRLFVANSMGDTVSFIYTTDDRIAATVLLRPQVVRDLPGATPTSLALAPDGQTLYAALGDMNAIAVIDVPSAQLLGYIPAGWYPSAIAITPDGRRLFVANAKGTAARIPNNVPDHHDPRRENAYILSLLEGNVFSITLSNDCDALRQSTRQVLDNNRLSSLAVNPSNPLAKIGISSGKIRHVIYIVKENRTYDQVLGDLPQGNGDPSLVLFGREVTPNQHALAERFVLLDNLYACGEVSGDGWCWSTQGMANAYVVRNVPYNYSGRGRKFDFEGQNNGYLTAGFPSTGEDGKPMAAHPSFKNGAPPIPDVANTGNNLWDAARRAGISFRNYGFFLYFADRNAGVIGGPDNYPTSPGLQPPGHDLAGVTDIDFRRFDMDYPDSDAPQHYFNQSGDPHCRFPMARYGKYDMPSRFAEWNREFQLMLAKDPSGAAVPALMTVRLPTDHTVGAKAGQHTPASYVADNDYALGQIVQAVSHSPIWKNTAIVVIEDDAQSGADHVDAHRTIGFVISPWIKAHSVDHRFYNTDSMLKTIELLLELSPLSQYDAVADPVMDWDNSPSNDVPYSAILPPMQLIAQTNPSRSELTAGDSRLELATRSQAMDFSHADAAPADQLNQIIWQTVKGPASHMPAPRYTLKDLTHQRGGADDDD